MAILHKTLAGMALCGMFATISAHASPLLTLTDTGAFSGSLPPSGPTINNNLIQIDPFNGFDWISNSSVVTTGYTGTTGEIVDTYYLASANEIFLAGGGTASLPGLVKNGQIPADPVFSWLYGNGYELTVYAHIINEVTCNQAISGVCVDASFEAQAGSTFKIFYDQNPNANRDLGTGFIDGLELFSGNITSGGGTFGPAPQDPPTPGVGVGQFSFIADITFTQTDSSEIAYVDSELSKAISGVELKLGSGKVTSGWVKPTSFTNAGIDAAKMGQVTTFALQADGNSTVVNVPEPSSLVLLSVGLLGAGAVSRRRKA